MSDHRFDFITLCPPSMISTHHQTPSGFQVLLDSCHSDFILLKLCYNVTCSDADCRCHLNSHKNIQEIKHKLFCFWYSISKQWKLKTYEENLCRCAQSKKLNNCVSLDHTFTVQLFVNQLCQIVQLMYYTVHAHNTFELTCEQILSPLKIRMMVMTYELW